MCWITRVPETVKQAKDLAQSIETTQDGGNGSFFKEVRVTHCDVEQRWLIVFSEKAYKREIKTLERRIAQERATYMKVSKPFCARELRCEQDALLAVERFGKTLKYHKCEGSISEHRKKRDKGVPANRIQDM